MRPAMIFAALCLVMTAPGYAEDIMATFQAGKSFDRTLIVTTNNEEIQGSNWDGFSGGGYIGFSISRDAQRVILTETDSGIRDGISYDKTSKTYIPFDKLPYITTIQEVTSTVFRATQQPPNENPDENESQQGGPGYPLQGVGSPDP